MAESPVFELAPDDLPPERDTGDTSPNRCQFDGCANAVTKPARGRTPKFCDEHRKAGASPTGKRAANWSRATEIETILNQYALGLSFTVTLVNPADGAIVATGMPNVIHQIVELGRVDKTWRKYLEAIATPGKYGPLVISVIAIALPIMANHKLVPVMLGDVVAQMASSGEGVS